MSNPPFTFFSKNIFFLALPTLFSEKFCQNVKNALFPFRIKHLALDILVFGMSTVCQNVKEKCQGFWSKKRKCLFLKEKPFLAIDKTFSKCQKSVKRDSENDKTPEISYAPSWCTF